MNNNFIKPLIPPNNNFSLLRFICCFIVIYEHTIILSKSTWIILNLREIAVDIFFIISGFWVTYSYLSSPNIKVYIFKRFKKIFPLYWTVVIGFAILLAFVSTLPINDYFLNNEFWKYFVVNFFTLNFIHPNLPGVFNGAPVNGSLWTIKIELGFYIILPLIVTLCFSKKENNLRGGIQMFSGINCNIYVVGSIWSFNANNN